MAAGENITNKFIGILVLICFLFMFWILGAFVWGYFSVFGDDVTTGVLSAAGAAATINIEFIGFYFESALALFEIITFYTIFEIGTYLTESRYGIEILWSVARDITNLIIVGLFLWTAFRMAVGLEKGDAAKKTLLWLGAGALLVNFSGFITLLLVDIGNFLGAIFFKFLSSDILSAFIDIEILLFEETQAALTQGGTANAQTEAFNLLFFHASSILAKVFIGTTIFGLALLFLVRAFKILAVLIISPVAVLGMLPIENKPLKDINGFWWKSMIGIILMPAAVFFNFNCYYKSIYWPRRKLNTKPG